MSKGQILTCLLLEAQGFGIMKKKIILNFVLPVPPSLGCTNTGEVKGKYELFPAIRPPEWSLKAIWWGPIGIFRAVSKLVKMLILQSGRWWIQLWFMWHPSHVQDSHPTQISHPQRPTSSISSTTLSRIWSPRLSTILFASHAVADDGKPQTPMWILHPKVWIHGQIIMPSHMKL